MTFDNTITLGNIVSASCFLIGLWVAVAKTYHSLDKRAALFEQTVLSHTGLLEQHSKRMEKNDETMVKIMNELQRLVGRLDALNPQALAQAASLAVNVVRAAEADALKTVADAAAVAVTALNTHQPVPVPRDRRRRA